MKTFKIITGDAVTPVDAFILAEIELAPFRDFLHSPMIVCLTGDDQAKMAALSVYLLNQGHKVILLPSGIDQQIILDPYVRYNLLLQCNQGETSLFLSEIQVEKGPIWDLIYFTSGSMGKVRPIGVSLDQLLHTVKGYREIYQVTTQSMIGTTLPVSYNFTFVAASLLAAVEGATFLHFEGEQQLINYVNTSRDRYDLQVLLANPVVIQALFEEESTYNSKLLVDSGGAPLSTTAIRLFRETIGDLREGYGLTETCSLTHFDCEGSTESLGTVGESLSFCHHWIEHEGNKPKLYVESVNIGLDLSRCNDHTSFPTSTFTGDLGMIDAQGRLRLLGRQDDCSINGLWPRDTLDAIGEILGIRCAMVRQPNDKEVIVKFWGLLSDKKLKQVQERLQNVLGLSINQMTITSIDGGFLHSKKIPR